MKSFPDARYLYRYVREQVELNKVCPLTQKYMNIWGLYLNETSLTRFVRLVPPWSNPMILEQTEIRTQNGIQKEIENERNQD